MNKPVNKTKKQAINAMSVLSTLKPWLTRDIEQGDLPTIYEMLKCPFPMEAIREGKTYYGLEIKGVRSQYIVDRLNEVLGMNHWNYTYNSVDEAKGKVYSAKCDITIQIGNWKDSLFIPLVSHSYVGGVDNISRFEAHKGAITNSMKKCASMFGIASDIYKGLMDPDMIEEGDTYEVLGEPVDSEVIERKEDPLPVGEKGDKFAQLLTAINSVKDKETFGKAKEAMDFVKDELTDDQMEIAVKALVQLEKKYGK